MSSASVSGEIKATLSFLPQGHLCRDLGLAFGEIAAHRGEFAEVSAATTQSAILFYFFIYFVFSSVFASTLMLSGDNLHKFLKCLIACRD